MTVEGEQLRMEDKIKVNDQFKIVFSIVKEISEDNIPKAVDYGISNEKFADLLEITQEAGLIKNIKILRGGSGKVHSLMPDGAKVTFEGLKYLHENSALMKTYRGLKEIKSWIPFIF